MAIIKHCISGYCNAFYQYNKNSKTAKVDLERFVLFLGHKFSDKISFFSEIELENARVVGGELSFSVRNEK